jgi:hypothetical protein
MAKALDRSTELDSISSKSKDLLSKSRKFRADEPQIDDAMIVSFLLSWPCGGFKLQRCFRS